MMNNDAEKIWDEIDERSSTLEPKIGSIASQDDDLKQSAFNLDQSLRLYFNKSLSNVILERIRSSVIEELVLPKVDFSWRWLKIFIGFALALLVTSLFINDSSKELGILGEYLHLLGLVFISVYTLLGIDYLMNRKNFSI